MDKKEELEKIIKEVAGCQKCPLFKTATNSVPGGPNPNAEIVFVGEAPGYWEDQKGIPFCGAAGNLLNKLLVTINLERKDVFICNILKHRPPGNRDPMPNEIAACTLFLEKQLLVIKPKVIITLGRFAMNYFLPEIFISQAHGQARKITWHNLNFILLPLYHPAAALRAGAVMRQLTEDFLKIPKILGIKLKEEKKDKVIKQETLF